MAPTHHFNTLSPQGTGFQGVFVLVMFSFLFTVKIIRRTSHHRPEPSSMEFHMMLLSFHYRILLFNNCSISFTKVKDFSLQLHYALPTILFTYLPPPILPSSTRPPLPPCLLCNYFLSSPEVNEMLDGWYRSTSTAFIRVSLFRQCFLTVSEHS